jgi:uncharacterized cupin superfamily protein
MDIITVEHNPTPIKLDTMAVDSWPIWEKGVSSFDWHYDQTEICYILEGEAVVTPVSGKAVTIGEGDLVNFPKGMHCTWNITSAIRKHYMFK